MNVSFVVLEGLTRHLHYKNKMYFLASVKVLQLVINMGLKLVRMKDQLLAGMITTGILRSIWVYSYYGTARY